MLNFYPAIEFVVVRLLKLFRAIIIFALILILKHTYFTQIFLRRRQTTFQLSIQTISFPQLFHRLYSIQIKLSIIKNNILCPKQTCLAKYIWPSGPIQSILKGRLFIILYFLQFKNNIQVLDIRLKIWMNLISTLNLTSETALQKQDLKKIKTILQFLMDNSDSVQFREPVDYVGMGLADYIILISNPMDLGTINDKLKQQQYRFVQQVLDDIQLIWDNCKTYNQSTSWIYGKADKMDRYFKKLIKNYFGSVIISYQIPKNPSLEIAQPNIISKASRTSKKMQKSQNKLFYEQEDDSMNNNEKSKIMQRMKKLNAQNLGIIIQIIMQNCPKAYKFVENDVCQIYIQKIENWLLSQIKEKIIQLKQNQDRLTKKVKI